MQVYCVDIDPIFLSLVATIGISLSDEIKVIERLGEPPHTT